MLRRLRVGVVGKADGRRAFGRHVDDGEMNRALQLLLLLRELLLVL